MKIAKFRHLSTAIILFSGISGASSEVLRLSERVFFIPEPPGAGTRFQMIIGAGCHDEPEPRCRGVAHYLEHLVMLGRNPGHSDAAVRLFGDGGANGWTVDRATVFFQMLPARPAGPRADLERLFGFYADRLKAFAITPEDAARERQVVAQEHDWRVQSNAFVPLERALNAALTPDRPSGQWTIGEREAILTLTVEEARAFHADWYHRNNAHFIVAGAIAPEEVRAIADKALANHAEQPLPTRAHSAPVLLEPARKDVHQVHAGIRRAGVIVKKAVAIPEAGEAEMRALRRLFSDFLISRLPGSLNDVLGEQAGLISTRPNVVIEKLGPGAYSLHVGIDVAADVDPAVLREALVGYLDGLADNAGLDDATIARLQKRFANSQSDIEADSRREFFQLSTWLSSGASFEDWQAWKRLTPELAPEKLRAFASAFAGEGRVVTGILEPPEGER